MAIHKHFAEICKLRDLNFSEVSRLAAPCSPSLITRWRSGELDPQIEVIQRIANALEVTLDYLVGNKGSAKPTLQVLAEEALEVYLNTAPIDRKLRALLRGFAGDPAYPSDVKGWRDYVERRKLEAQTPSTAL